MSAFYFRVVRKITSDLKVPFVLKDNIRQDDTPLHRTLREAMVNTLVHADYTDRASVLVVKEPAGFTFRNPGTLRVPVTRALQGGESDCRNRTLQQMFLMIGFGERAGSGLTRIQHGLETAGGTLRLFDSFEPYDQTRLELKIGAAPAEMSGKTSGKTSGKMSGKTPDRILTLLRSAPNLAIPDIAAVLGQTERTVERASAT
jgi:predicted HTH transcriptional regulator